ncbi:MAG: hypothetical protein AVDCRST_MAG06-453, partial [uncultured Nocardioides sp.]
CRSAVDPRRERATRWSTGPISASACGASSPVVRQPSTTPSRTWPSRCRATPAPGRRVPRGSSTARSPSPRASTEGAHRTGAGR